MESQEHIFMINSSVERTRGNRAINAAEDENYGEILKSGDNTLLRYKIFDGDGETLQLEGLPCEAVIKKDDQVIYSTPAEIDAENIVSFKITEVLPSDRNNPYRIEFIITQGQDTLIFPSDDRINLYMYPSSLSAEVDIIEQTPEERLNEIVIVAVNDATQDFYSEVDNFRDTYDELIDTGVIQENINQKLAESEAEYAPRLTELEQNDADLTAQLAHTDRIKVGGGVTAEPEDLSPRTLGLVTGEGGPINLLTKPQLNSVTPDTTTFVKKGKNKWNGEFFTDFMLSGSPTVTLLKYDDTVESLVVIERIKPNTTYTVSRKSISTNNDNYFKAAVFSDYPELYDTGRAVNLEPGVLDFTFTTSPDEKYLVHVVSRNMYREPEEYMIEEGSIKTAYEHHDVVEINLRNLPSKELEKFPERKLHITHKIKDNFESNLDYVNPWVNENYDDNDVNDIYVYYDRIVQKSPDYAKKTVLGYEPTGLPINLYTLTPPIPKNNPLVEPYKHPKVIIVTGTHGIEKHAAASTAKFFEHMNDDWLNDPFLEAIRQNFELLIIPSLNPWGWNQNQRKNSNGVDLNRNFPARFTKTNDPNSMYYSGEYAGSEVETQIMMSFLEEHKDALTLIDHHDSSSYEVQGQVIWTGSHDDSLREMLGGFLKFMGSQSKKIFPYLPQDQSVERFSPSTGGGVISYGHEVGIDSILLETAVENDMGGTQKLGENAVGNLFISLINYYS